MDEYESWRQARQVRDEHEMEHLEDLIRRCIEEGRIEDCLQEEGGLYSITVGERTYWLDPDQARRLLERLLREGGQG